MLFKEITTGKEREEPQQTHVDQEKQILRNRKNKKTTTTLNDENERAKTQQERFAGTLPDARGAGGGGHAPRLPPARHRHLRPELPQAEKRGARGRESGARRRVSPRTARTTSSPAVKHPRASWNKLGTRRRGAEMRRGLSAKKREEPFGFPRLSFPPARARPRAWSDRRPEPGTGTLPDAGGAGGRRTRHPLPTGLHSALSPTGPPQPRPDTGVLPLSNSS